MQDLLLLFWLSLALTTLISAALLIIWRPWMLKREPRAVVVTDSVSAHRLLVRGAAGGAFSSRPPSAVASAVLSRQRHCNITSAPYGAFWLAIRRNLTAQVFHPSRLCLHAPARRRALAGLIADLRRRACSLGAVDAASSTRLALAGLAAAMCFGDGVVGARQSQDMADVMDDLLESFVGLRALIILPAALTRVVYRKRWDKLVSIRRRQEELYLPLVDLRRRHRAPAAAYVDTLIELMVPDEGGKPRVLTDGEVVALVSEFLGAGTEPVAAELHWIMGRLVKHPGVQAAVRSEIEAVVGANAEQVDEEALGRLHYLKAVIMETLRMHPTVPVVQRQVTEDDNVALHDGQRVPAGTAVKFPLERLARNKAAWAEPDEFRPERFLAGGEGEGVNLAVAVPGGRMIRMMPFGAGRRMCPGWSIAVLHLGYFVANLVREFQWAEAEGELDLQPRLRGLVTVMKRPLRVRLTPLRHKTCY